MSATNYLEDRIFELIADKSSRVCDVVPFYALVQETSVFRDLNVTAINDAIVNRWSFSSLKKIKAAALKKMEHDRSIATVEFIDYA